MEMTLEDTKHDLHFKQDDDESGSDSAVSSELGIDSLTLLNGILVQYKGILKEGKRKK